MAVYRLNIDGPGMGFHRRRVAEIIKRDGAEQRLTAAAAKRAKKAAKRIKGSVTIAKPAEES